jgi:hypothetical protein
VGEVAFERYRLPTLIAQGGTRKVCSLRACSRRAAARTCQGSPPRILQAVRRIPISESGPRTATTWSRKRNRPECR